MKPILFSTDMVRAILRGDKMQTRRVMKPQNIFSCEGPYRFDIEDQILVCGRCRRWAAKMDGRTAFAPPHAPGDILWVREATRITAYRKDNTAGAATKKYPINTAPTAEVTTEVTSHETH